MAEFSCTDDDDGDTMTYKVGQSTAIRFSASGSTITTVDLTDFINGIDATTSHYDGGKSATYRSSLTVEDTKDYANVQHSITSLLSVQVRQNET